MCIFFPAGIARSRKIYPRLIHFVRRSESRPYSQIMVLLPIHLSMSLSLTECFSLAPGIRFLQGQTEYNRHPSQETTQESLHLLWLLQTLLCLRPLSISSREYFSASILQHVLRLYDRAKWFTWVQLLRFARLPCGIILLSLELPLTLEFLLS